MIVINRIEEIEEQRSGRNKNTTINNTYINSGKYRKKFDSISSDESLNCLLFQLAKKMLKKRLFILPRQKILLKNITIY